MGKDTGSDSPGVKGPKSRLSGANGITPINDKTETESVYEESTEWIRNANSMKDIRNIVATSGCYSILFGIIPQLVSTGVTESL